MACISYSTGGTITIPPPFDAILSAIGLSPEIDSQWVTFAFQAILAYLLLEEQEAAEAELEKIANCSITAAEELYDAYYDLREYDQAIYDVVNEHPSYKARPVKAIQAKRQATQFLKNAMGSTNRYECGTRSQILRETLRATVVSDALEQEILEQQEILTEDTYYENCILSKIGIASGDMPNISSALTTSGALWATQFEAARQDAVGAIAGLAYTASSLFAPSQGQFQVGARGGDAFSAPLAPPIFGGY